MSLAAIRLYVTPNVLADECLIDEFAAYMLAEALSYPGRSGLLSHPFRRTKPFTVATRFEVPTAFSAEGLERRREAIR